MTSTDAAVKSILSRRDEYHIALAALLGAEFVKHGNTYRYNGYYWTLAEASRIWLHDHDHDLNGWQEKSDDTP